MWWNKYLHIPFLDNGRDEKGADCWGLVRLIYGFELGITLPSYDNRYDDTEQYDVLNDIVLHEKQNWLNPQSPDEFDVVILRMSGVPVHVGVITHGRNMIHCSKGVGTSHENIDSMRWRNKVEGFARWKN